MLPITVSIRFDTNNSSGVIDLEIMHRHNSW